MHRPRNDPALFGGPYPFFQTGDVKAADLRLTAYEATYNDTGLAQSRLWPVDTLCITIAANIADAAILAVPGCFPDSIVGFTSVPGKSDVVFVKYLLDYIKHRFESIARGTTQDNLSLDKLVSVPVKYPTLPMQRKIAAILSAYDDLIENNNRRIKLLEEMAQRIYREWFVDFRYPGHDNVRLIDSELGPVPQGWRTGTLSNLVDVNANTIRTFDPDETIQYIDISAVSKGVVSAPRRVSLGEAPGRARRRVADGDILWSSVRPNLRAHALVLSLGSDCVASTGFAVLSPRRASFAYIYVMTTTDAFVEYLNGRATGSAYPAVTPPVFQNAPVVLPPQAKLDDFADAADPLMRLAARLGSANRNLRASRDLLLPRLISGEVDVADLNIAMVEDAA
jgi:type I restriction enzyme S subunit